jgi:hypothetical protein
MKVMLFKGIIITVLALVGTVVGVSATSASAAAIKSGVSLAALTPIPVGGVRGHLICPPGRLGNIHAHGPIHCRFVPIS